MKTKLHRAPALRRCSFSISRGLSHPGRGPGACGWRVAPCVSTKGCASLAGTHVAPFATDVASEPPSGRGQLDKCALVFHIRPGAPPRPPPRPVSLFVLPKPLRRPASSRRTRGGKPSSCHPSFTYGRSLWPPPPALRLAAAPVVPLPPLAPPAPRRAECVAPPQDEESWRQRQQVRSRR